MAGEKLNIFQKIDKIRQMVEVLQKDSSGYNYKYISDTQILAKVTAGMKKYGLILIPTIVPGTLKVEPYTYNKIKFAKDGTQYEDITNEVLVTAETIQTWINIENPEERIEIPWVMVGQQSDAAQAGGSGLSYWRRYALINFFSISAVENDVDAWRSTQKQAEKAEEIEVAKSIIAQVDGIVQEQKMDDATKNKFIAELKKVIRIDGKPGTNYMMVSDPAVASRVLATVKKFFNVKEVEE